MFKKQDEPSNAEEEILEEQTPIRKRRKRVPVKNNDEITTNQQSSSTTIEKTLDFTENNNMDEEEKIIINNQFNNNTELQQQPIEEGEDFIKRKRRKSRRSIQKITNENVTKIVIVNNIHKTPSPKKQQQENSIKTLTQNNNSSSLTIINNINTIPTTPNNKNNASFTINNVDNNNHEEKKEEEEIKPIEYFQEILSSNKLFHLSKILHYVKDFIYNTKNKTFDNLTVDTFILQFIKKQIQLRLQKAKEMKLTNLPEKLEQKLSDLFTIVIPYLRKVEEKQDYLNSCFESNYSSCLYRLFVRFYIPSSIDIAMGRSVTGPRFLQPEEDKDYELRDKERDEIERKITEMYELKAKAKMMGSGGDDGSEEMMKDVGVVSEPLKELLEKHKHRYMNGQNRLLLQLATPSLFVKSGDLFNHSRIQKLEAQRKQQEMLQMKKKLAHSSTVQVEMPADRFTGGIKVKKKKNNKRKKQ
ncbi:hypothetical protein ABK040_000054 [Willaertia magna]